MLEQLGILPELFVAASRTELETAHDRDYLDALERLAAEGGGWMGLDTFVGPSSVGATAAATGAVCRAVENVMEGSGPAFAAVRPPGHHAGADYGKGFCLTNHVAVGAMRAKALGASKVLIVDFDVHHGNGTQDIFWNDAAVLYISIHQYPWFPGTGALDEVGDGTTVNIPLGAGAGDRVYKAALQRIVLPIARSFQPDVIACSAGFDAHLFDPLSLMQVTEAGFGAIAGSLRSLAEELCDGRLAMVLEGGYDLEGLARSLTEVLRALGGDPYQHQGEIQASVSEEVDRIAAFHASRWPIA